MCTALVAAGDVRHRGGDLVLVELQPGEDRVEVAQERVDRPQERREVVAEAACGGPGSRSSTWRSPGAKPSKKPFASGASLPKAISVGESCSAAGTSWRTSGSVLIAKDLSRSRVSRDSSSKVGKARNSASMSWSRCGGRLEDVVRGLDQVRELAFAAAEGAQGDGAVAEELAHRQLPGCRGCGRACRIR